VRADRLGEMVAFHDGRAYSLRVYGPSLPTWDPRTAIDEWLERFAFTD
jgi:hypothetical protein